MKNICTNSNLNLDSQMSDMQVEIRHAGTIREPSRVINYESAKGAHFVCM
jgi:hypothetical protein